MIKKLGLWYTIKYYGVIWYLASLIGILLTHRYIADYVKILVFDGNIARGFKGMYYAAFPIILLIIWCTSLFSSIRSKTYKYLTGRSYGKDKSQYNRTYYELVDYFNYSHAEPHKLDTDKFPIMLKKDWRSVKGIIFGMYMNNINAKKGNLIYIPSDSECNIGIYGPPGSGKTSGFAIINAMTFKGSTLVVDIKGDIYNYVSKHTKRRIIRFCPDHPKALKVSARFDPFAGLETLDDSEKKLFIKNMCIVLLPDEGGTDGNYFTMSARKMMQGIYYLLEEKYREEQVRLTFPAFVHEILEGNIINWVKKAVAGNNQRAKEYLASFFQNNEKNLTGAYDVICRSLINFSSPLLDELLSGGKNCISIDHLEKGYDIYLQISQEHLDAYAPLFTLIIQNFSTAFTKRPDSSTGKKNRPILMLLDEFPQLTFSYKMINSNLSTLRSKSIICCLIMQGYAQLTAKYGKDNANAILGNCYYQVILGSNDINASKEFSDKFGTKKILKRGNSLTSSKDKTYNVNVQEAEERVFPPEYFGDLHEHGKEIIYFKGKYVECNKINCYKD